MKERSTRWRENCEEQDGYAVETRSPKAYLDGTSLPGAIGRLWRFYVDCTFIVFHIQCLSASYISIYIGR